MKLDNDKIIRAFIRESRRREEYRRAELRERIAAWLINGVLIAGVVATIWATFACLQVREEEREARAEMEFNHYLRVAGGAR